MWIELILIWLALNVVLVMLLWWRSSKPAAPEHASITDRPALTLSPAAHPAAGPQAGTSAAPPALGLSASPCSGRQGDAVLSSCRLRELQAEIRDLKLTVAELSLDKARLSSAIARQRC